MCDHFRPVLIKRYKKRLTEISKLRPNGGKLLDIGCSIGTFLKIAASYKVWNCTGVEVNSTNAEFARSAMGLNIINSELKEAKLPNKSLDTVTILLLPTQMEPSRKQLQEPGFKI